MNTDLWINIAGPIISAIAIVVAVLISRRSSRDSQKQIDAMHKQIDAFKAAQAPEMLAKFEQYQSLLEELDEQIEDAQEQYEIVSPFIGRGGAKIDDLVYLDEKKRQAQGLNQLKAQRKKIVNQIRLINTFLGKAEE